MPQLTTKQAWDSQQLRELLRKQMQIFRRTDKVDKPETVEPSKPPTTENNLCERSNAKPTRKGLDSVSRAQPSCGASLVP